MRVLLIVALYASCADDEPKLPTCPTFTNAVCTRAGVCTIDGERCQIRSVDGGAP